MALKVKNNFIKEDIEDTEGNKIGEIKFNPKDSRIMSKLAIILKDLETALRKINNIKIEDVPKGDLETIEDFEKFSDICNNWKDATDIENGVIEKIINDLSEVFDSETILCFTQGTNDLESLMPLIEFVLPYIKEYKTEKVSKYIPSKNNDVME